MFSQDLYSMFWFVQDKVGYVSYQSYIYDVYEKQLIVKVNN